MKLSRLASLKLLSVFKWKASSSDVVDLSVGEPEHLPPPEVVEEVYKSLKHGFGRYASPKGLTELRTALSEFIGQRYGCKVSPENVMVTPGAKAALYLLLNVLVDPGELVGIFDPYFYPYYNITRVIGGEVKFIELKWDGGFTFNIDKVFEVVDAGAKLVILNSPHNPTGAVIGADELCELVDYCRRRGVVIISDEVYADLVYEGAHASIASCPGWLEVGVLVGSFSKTFAMTGWRIGFMVANEKVVEVASKLAANMYTCVPPFIQKAAIKALELYEDVVDQIRRRYHRTRDLAYNLFSKLPGVEVYKPQGGIFMFPRVEGAIRMLGVADSVEFSEKLLEAGVAVVPGVVFSNAYGRTHVRMNFAVSEDKLVKAYERIRALLEGR